MSAARHPLWYLCQELRLPVLSLLVRQLACALVLVIFTGPSALDRSHNPCFRVGWLPFQFRPLTRHLDLASDLEVNVFAKGEKNIVKTSKAIIKNVFFMIIFLVNIMLLNFQIKCNYHTN